jgi:hypothetical protein
MRTLLMFVLAISLSPAAFAEKKWIPADRAVACAEASDKELCADC